MALVKFGGGVSEMRGKEAGNIFSRNAYGSYIKQKVSPVNPQTTKQLDQRTMMGNLSKVWAGLTAGQKAGWDNLGAQVTRVNRFGDTTYYTGFALFMKLNRNVIQLGGSAQSTAPSTQTIPTITLDTLEADVSDGTIEVTLNTNSFANYTVLLYMTPNIVTGRRFVKNFYRYIGTIANSFVQPHDAQAQFTAYFGTVPVAGAQLFAKVKIVHTATGFEGVPSTNSCVVTA